MADEQSVPPAPTSPSSTTEPAPAAARDAAASDTIGGGEAESDRVIASCQPAANAQGAAATAAPDSAGPAEPSTPGLAAELANQPAASARPEMAEPTASNAV